MANTNNPNQGNKQDQGGKPGPREPREPMTDRPAGGSEKQPGDTFRQEPNRDKTGNQPGQPQRDPDRGGR